MNTPTAADQQATLDELIQGAKETIAQNKLHNLFKNLSHNNHVRAAVSSLLTTVKMGVAGTVDMEEKALITYIETKLGIEK